MHVRTTARTLLGRLSTESKPIRQEKVNYGWFDLRIEHDREADAAYLRISRALVVKTLPVVGPTGQILQLDFDADHRLVGIDAVPASAFFRPDVLR